MAKAGEGGGRGGDPSSLHFSSVFFPAAARRVGPTFRGREEIAFLWVRALSEARGVGVISREMRISIGAETHGETKNSL